MHFENLAPIIEAHPAVATIITSLVLFLLGGLATLIRALFFSSQNRNIKTDGGKYVEGDDHSVNYL